MSEKRNLNRFALILRIAGMCILSMDMHMQGNPYNTIYYYVPFLFIVLELILYTGHVFFHKTSWMYAEHGLIYYLILVLAYTLWSSPFSVAMAVLFTIGFVIHFIWNRREEKRNEPKKLKY